ncbi:MULTISPECIES: VOC family protein [Bacillus]|uniref:Glyoxalase n=2 Tax=Bacillus TaxID=1386 RepID=A0A0M4FWF9_9BACI|nr:MULTISPECIES: VOC family protein [Bacillus]ALC81238.1 glyoxalase [Bacillus gobiensis]MBP1080231.1 PhnB protein [Bacillus capparidis]MED1094099.1 VOC family protein [Bacillus capparidis]
MKQQATPYLLFNGNAREALEYYKEIFEGEIIELQTYGEADYPTPPEADEKIIHAQFKKGNLFLMASDSFPGSEVEFGSNISLALEIESEEEIQNLYDRFTERGTALMELQDTFWGAKYGKVKDPYGVIWDLNFTKA